MTPVRARSEVLHQSFRLAGVLLVCLLNACVMVPFEGYQNRKVRICTEAIPFPGQTTKIKAQVCGKFLGQRLQ